MPAMLSPKSPSVKPLRPAAALKSRIANLPSWASENLLIWATFGTAALLLWVTGLDVLLAHTLYHPTLSPHAFSFATFLRQNGTLPGTILAVLGLIAMLWPRLWKTRPLLYRTAMVVTLTAVLGVGLTNQIIVKNLADRPRPSEVILADTPPTFTDGFRGNSMPSGHAAMGFILAAPFFPLRRRKPKLAVTFLATGLTAGLVVGTSRMMLGAHFATDVLIAGAIALSAASLFTFMSQRIPRIHPTIIGAGMLIATLAVILGNRFNITLTLPITEPFKQIQLPCPITAVPAPQQSQLTVILKGYGAPLSNLALVQKDGLITLQRHLGLYHSLTCEATLTTPTE